MDLLELAKLRQTEINELVRDVEVYESTESKLDGKNIICITDKKNTVYLDSVLTDEQMVDIKQYIMNLMEQNNKTKNDKLRELCGLSVENKKRTGNRIKPNPLDTVKVIEMYKGGMTLDQIAKEFHVRRERVAKITEDAGIKKERAKTICPTENYDEAKIRELYVNKGMSVTEIANKLGYAKSSLYKYLETTGIKFERPRCENVLHM